MKKTIQIYDRGKKVDKVINYIPVRYIFAIILTILETVLCVALTVGFTIYIPYFYIAAMLTHVVVIISIICSNDNPDYKVPWLLFVMLLPVIGFMLYFLFYTRKLNEKYIKRINHVSNSLDYDDSDNFKLIEDELVKSEAKILTKIANTHLYHNTKLKYFSIGEDFMESLLLDLKNAKEFIFFEFFIVEEGVFWNSILNILKEKASAGLTIKVTWDDIGCMSTLPGNYSKILKNYGIDAVPYSRLKGQADNEFNNRNHRKILVIDGIIGYTGGINIADEYINKIVRFGHWKDMGIRLEGDSVNELTKLFLTDFYTNKKDVEDNLKRYYKNYNLLTDGFIIPFGDGPKPIYNDNVGKIVIMNMLNHAKKYVYITSPYLVIDSELTNTIKNTALRGVNVKIILPHIPDKKLVFDMARSAYDLLMKSGVEIYEYEPGFVHGKLYISDDKIGMIGTINLDYRSLTHHFENGVWIYNDNVIIDMKNDYINTLKKCIFMNDEKLKVNIFKKIIRSIVKIFSPLL